MASRPQVVAPGLFDAIAQPDVMLPLVMANAMSPRLWRLARRVAEAPDPLEAARVAVDRSFTHVAPDAMARVSGLIDLDAERRRLGPQVVDRALDEIDRAWDERRRRGLLADGDSMQQMIAARRFPAYSYANVDVIHAARHADGGGSRRPRDLTSCVDEAALFAAMLMTAPRTTDALDGIVMLASSTHSTVFGWTGDESWWFWSKRSLFTRERFRAHVEQHHGGDPADALVHVMAAPTRRIVSRRGHVDLDAGTSSLPPDELRRTLHAVRGFFGQLPPGLEGAAGQLRVTPPSAYDDLYAHALRCGSPDEVQSLVRRHAMRGGPTGEAALQSLLAFRSLEVPDLMPYLHAARNGPLVARLAEGLDTTDDLLAAVGALQHDAALGDDTRLALPDEVLGRGSGSAAERALLVHVLLERLTGAEAHTVLADGDAITQAGSFAVRASDLAMVSPLPASHHGPAFRGNAPAHQQ